MIALKTVLCPVDFSPATSRQVAIAADLCNAFGGKLVLHHNRHSLGTGVNVGWMWNAEHQRESQASIEAKLKDCLAQLPAGVPAETLMTEGPVSRAVITVAQTLEADLVVMTAHGRLADDHASLTEQMLDHGGRPVLVLHEANVEPRTPRFASRSKERQVVVAPTDLSPESRGAAMLALDLVRALPVDLRLLHLLPNGRAHRRQADVSADDARQRLQALVPPDLADRVTLDVRPLEQRDAARAIASIADELSASCIVMGEHMRSPARRWFARDASLGVLHEAHCPVWYVPAPVAL